MNLPLFDTFAITDIGTKRINNEDVIATLPSHGFFAIADGIGGHKAGEIAAKVATNELINFVSKYLDPKNPLSQQQIISSLHLGIIQANKKVYDLAKEKIDFQGMGTTLCCLHVYKDIITYANVGDSRLYRFRQDNIIQLTKDHSLIANIPNDQIKDHFPHKNIITRAIGACSFIEPSINSEKFLAEDIYLLCTDGLSDFLSSDELNIILKKAKKNDIDGTDIDDAVKKLIEAAKNKGSRDNISAVLIQIKK